MIMLQRLLLGFGLVDTFSACLQVLKSRLYIQSTLNLGRTIGHEVNSEIKIHT
jgi:hypothetical protein